MKYLLLMLFTSVAFAGGNGSLMVNNCYSSNGIAQITTVAPKGRWLGFSARDASGKIHDEPPVKLPYVRWMGSKSYTFRFPSGMTQIRSSSWKSYKKGLMHTRYADTGWVSCGR